MEQTSLLSSLQLDKFDELRVEMLSLELSIWQLGAWKVTGQTTRELMMRRDVREAGRKAWREWVGLWHRAHETSKTNAAGVRAWELFRRGVMRKGRQTIGSDCCVICYR